MAWFLRPKENRAKGNKTRELPDGLWVKCDSCGEVIYKKQLEETLYTCPACDHHFRVSPTEYVEMLFDAGTFEETNQNVRSADPLEFEDTKPYVDRLEAAYKKQPSDALTTGKGQVEGHAISFACMNFKFIGGSMGAVVGEKFARAADVSLEENIPFVCVTASGGARMMESALSLMQMAKTSAKLAQLAEKGIPYVVILTDPTTGGVTASFAMLGDIHIAEPGALIGFAGPRVIEQTIRRKLPQGFQRSEFLMDHGFVDMIVHRKDLKAKLAHVLSMFAS